jgi:hypothetical protein
MKNLGSVLLLLIVLGAMGWAIATSKDRMGSTPGGGDGVPVDDEPADGPESAATPESDEEAAEDLGEFPDTTGREPAKGPTKITVLGPGGRPVEGATVQVSARTREPAFHESSFSLPHEWKTDRDGVVSVPPLDPKGKYTVWIDPADESDLLRMRPHEWVPSDVTVRLVVGRALSGRVVDSEGEPVAHAHVGCQCWGRFGHWSTSTSADAEGRFSVRGVPPVTCWLAAAEAGEKIPPAEDSLEEMRRLLTSPRPARRAPKGWLEVDRSRGDLVLVVPGSLRRPSMHLRVLGFGNAVGPSGPTAGRSRAYLLSEDKDPQATRVGLVEADGRVRFDQVLADATYALWVPPGGERGAVLERGIRWRKDEIEVRTLTTGDVVVRLAMPAGSKNVQVHAFPPIGLRIDPIEGTARPDGRYEFRGMPHGPWTIRAKARAPDAWVSGSAVVDAGQEAEVELRPK